MPVVEEKAAIVFAALRSVSTVILTGEAILLVVGYKPMLEELMKLLGYDFIAIIPSIPLANGPLVSDWTLIVSVYITVPLFATILLFPILWFLIK